MGIKGTVQPQRPGLIGVILRMTKVTFWSSWISGLSGGTAALTRSIKGNAAAAMGGGFTGDGDKTIAAAVICSDYVFAKATLAKQLAGAGALAGMAAARTSPLRQVAGSAKGSTAGAFNASGASFQVLLCDETETLITDETGANILMV